MTQLAERIAQEIACLGPIPFARFMELALYCPVYGYYEKEPDNPGRGGDYFTSVSVGGLFGRLLACQFADWLSECGVRSAERGMRSGECGIQLVETGAHRGDLANDILRWLREHRPELYSRLDYWLVEPSERRRQWQQQTLSEFGAKVHWAAALSNLAPRPSPLAPPPSVLDTPPSAIRPSHSNGVHGLIFSNELLDAMPVHRLGWDANRKCWFEWGVALDGDNFVWTRLADISSALHASRITYHVSRLTYHVSRLTPHAPLLDALPDGFTLEVSPAAEAWWRQAASVLASGKLLTFDYGLSAEEFLLPERKAGTLRAYYRHQVTADVLAQPGSRDLTAHIDFTALQQAGESAGLTTDALLAQEQFLTPIAARIWNGDLPFEPWTPAHTRQFQTLTHPSHLGRAFRVLVQSR